MLSKHFKLRVTSVQIFPGDAKNELLLRLLLLLLLLLLKINLKN
jgi:hypothetical protein